MSTPRETVIQDQLTEQTDRQLRTDIYNALQQLLNTGGTLTLVGVNDVLKTFTHGGKQVEILELAEWNHDHNSLVKEIEAFQNNLKNKFGWIDDKQMVQPITIEVTSNVNKALTTPSSPESPESQKFPVWIWGNNDVQKKATMDAYNNLSEWHKAKKAIEHWKTMSLEKQEKVQFRYNNGRWSCNINNTGWTLIDSQQYVRDNLPKGILDSSVALKDRKEEFQKKEVGVIQHATSEGLAVHFTRVAADRYIASQSGIWLSGLTKTSVNEYKQDIYTLLWIDRTAWSDPDGDLLQGNVGHFADLWVDRGCVRVSVDGAWVDGGDHLCGLSLLLQDTSVA